MGLLPANPGKPPGPPNNPPNPADILPRGYSKGTSKVAPMPKHGSWRGDASGSLSPQEHAGVPHPALATEFKKK